MNTQEQNKKNLDFIFKNGDLYDIISLKDGRALTKNPFLKVNIFLLSRILYVGVLLWEKIKQHYARVEKVKQAQTEIRESLGVNVDVITFKEVNSFGFKRKRNKYLSILYQEDAVEKETYIGNLQKILNFVELYHLDNVYLRSDDITDNFVGVDLSDFKTIFLADVLDGNLGDENALLLCLSKKDLLKLISILKCLNISKSYINQLGEKIKDLVIKNALEDFYCNNDIDKLKDIVKVRLEMFLNSGASYRDRINGKVFETINVYDELIRVVVRNQEGKIIDNKIMTLLDYFEVKDFKDISFNQLSDDAELLFIAALYSYLCNNKNINNESYETFSFYDKIYKRFLLKKNKKLKNIQGLCSKKYKWISNCLFSVFSLGLTIDLFVSLVLAGISLDFINLYCFRNKETSIFSNIMNTITIPYFYSFNLEINLFKKPITEISEGVGSFFNDYVLVGDTNNHKETMVASINTLGDNTQLPKYFATGYAVSSSYLNGSKIYQVDYPDFLVFENVEPLFEVSYLLNSSVLEELKDGYRANLFKTFYPVGNDYVLTKIYIQDMNSDKEFTISYNELSLPNVVLKEGEIDIVLSMQKPKITYTYGVSSSLSNAFVDSLQNNDYYTGSNTEIKKAIVNKLGLNSDASLEEILGAIKSKQYSKTPFEDAKIRDLEIMNEKEYFEVVASLDSLVCNLATSLAVESCDDLIYVVGYANKWNQVIMTGDAHAWAMNTNGDILEVTPALTRDEENIIQTVLTWGVQNNIHIFTIMTLIALITKKLFGKKIVLSLKILNIKNILNDSNIFDAYAKINEVLYRGINLPKKVSNEVFIDKISNDFRCFTYDELEALKEKLKQEIDDRKISSCTLRLVKQIPYIRDNAVELKRILQKTKFKSN